MGKCEGETNSDALIISQQFDVWFRSNVRNKNLIAPIRDGFGNCTSFQ